MSKPTQTAIMVAFMSLLKERSLDKITVIDITRKCGVNRNTFYYHYHDIYDLLDTIFKQEEERLVSIALEDFSNWTESFYEGIRWSMENKEAIYHIYKSSNRDRLESFLFRAGRTSARRYMDVQAQGLEVPEHYIEDATHVLGVTLAGLVLEWFNEGMKGDPREFIARVADFTGGTMRAMLQRVEHE